VRKLLLLAAVGVTSTAAAGLAQFGSDLPSQPAARAIGVPIPPAPAAPQPLDGEWQITAAIDDGEVFSPDTVKAKLALDSRFVIKGQTITVTRPNGERREILFVANPKASPATIDLAGASGAKAIYLASGDTLMFCMAGPGIASYPTEFASRPGSHALLMTLKRVQPQPVPGIGAIVPAIAPPVPAPVRATLTDAQIRQMLVGTWGHQDRDKVEYLTLNPDGSYSAVWDMKRAFKQLFEGEHRTSGSWKVDQGVMIFTVTGSTEKDLRNQIFSYRINSITDRDLIYIDMEGGVRREWKVR
jgi:uncharacterized protein (TIGR03067 family)